MDMKAKDAQKLRNKLLIVGFVLLLVSYLHAKLIVVGAIVMVFCLILELRYNRCPHCKKRLGRNEGEVCQHCGGKIE